MRLKKNTLLLLLAAILLGSSVYIFESKNRERQQLVREQNLFDLEIEDIQKIIIDRPEGILEFIPLDRNWQMIRPEKTIVNQGVMLFLLDLILEGKSDRKFEISSDKLEEYGLKNPLATITIDLKDKTQKKIKLGRETINPNIIYAEINPQQNNSNHQIVLVSKNWQYAVDRNIGEWKVN